MKKLKTTIFLVFLVSFLMFAGFNIFAPQGDGDVYTERYDAGKCYYTQWTTVDSATNYSSDWFDWSDIDNQTLSAFYDYVTPGGASDSGRIIIQGRLPRVNTNGTRTYMYVGLDTQLVWASTTSGAVPLNLSLTAWSGEVRIFIGDYASNHASTQPRDGTLWAVAIYGRDMDRVTENPNVQW